MTTDFDLVVIGGGSGGLACAKRAASYGASVALFEREHLGGTCVNRGCVPKKLMWDAAQIVRAQHHLCSMRISDAPHLDYAQLVRSRDTKIHNLRDTFRDNLEDAGVTVIRDEAVLISGTEVAYDGKILQAGRVVLATGASPNIPEIPGADLTDSSDDVFRWESLPDRVLIVGGGYIGCEFASILAAFGVEVSLATSGDRLLEGFDAAAAGRAAQNLERVGVTLQMGARLSEVDNAGDMLLARFDDDSETAASRVILATGRTANTDVVRNLDTPPQQAPSGAFLVDNRLETTVPRLHAIGDVADRLPLTPVATRDGETLADILFGAGGALISLTSVATTAFLHPPVAQVGRLNGAQSTATETTSTPLPSGVLATDSMTPQQFAKLVTDRDSGALRGVALVGEGAGETIALAATLLAAGAKGSDFAAATAVHPSFTEEFVGR